MNFTLSLIYPAADEQGAKNISASELVCVLDADQTCSSSFFGSLLRYIDSGDDVAAAIAPRIHYNVDADCDIFDHQRVAYYEKTQLGMDAYGFTACMHTNMLLRVRALQEVGWFPRHTHSENWELGMLFVRSTFLSDCCTRRCPVHNQTLRFTTNVPAPANVGMHAHVLLCGYECHR